MKAAGFGQGAGWMTSGMISGALDYTSKIEERQRADASSAPKVRIVRWGRLLRF